MTAGKVAVPTGMARSLLLKKGPNGDGETPEGGSVDSFCGISAIDGDGMTVVAGDVFTRFV